MDQLPVVEYIALSSEYGELSGVWYNPGYRASGSSQNSYPIYLGGQYQEPYQGNQGYYDPLNGYISEISGLSYPYPNPCTDSIYIQFFLRMRSGISMWITPAVLYPQEASSADLIADHVFYSVHKIILRELYNNVILSAGQHRITWDLKDYSGNNIPAGFYRIYALFIDRLFYQDIWVYYNPSDLPADFRRYLQK